MSFRIVPQSETSGALFANPNPHRPVSQVESRRFSPAVFQSVCGALVPFRYRQTSEWLTSNCARPLNGKSKRAPVTRACGAIDFKERTSILAAIKGAERRVE